MQSWRGNRVWWFPALLHSTSPPAPPPLDWQKGRRVLPNYSHKGLLHTHRTHSPEDLLTVVSLSFSWDPKQTWTVSSCGEAPRTKSTHRRRQESRDYKEMREESKKPFCTQLSGESFLKDLLISTVCKKCVEIFKVVGGTRN